MTKYGGWVSLAVCFIADRVFKILALGEWSNQTLLGRYFGWYPFLNKGVAFGIPVPLPVMIPLSVLIVGGILWWYFKTKQVATMYEMSTLLFLVLGALSNLYDRVVYRATIDYLLIITGVFNIADFMIVTGFILLWLSTRAKEKQVHS